MKQFIVIFLFVFSNLNAALATSASLFPNSENKETVYSHCALEVYKSKNSDIDIPINKIEKHVSKHKNVQILEAFHEKEDAYFYVMDSMQARLAGYAHAPNNKTADELKSYIKLALQQDFGKDMKVYDNDDSLMLKELLLVVLYSTDLLKSNEHLLPEDENVFKFEIKRRYEKLFKIPKSKKIEKLESCKVGKNLFDCQNHSYMYAQVRGLYGHVFDVNEDVAYSEAMFRFAIDDLSNDGALWREASRGAWSWKYYSHALGNLLAISEISRVSGENIISYKSEISEKNIHDAIHFFINSIRDRELMYKYSKIDAGTSHYDEFADHKNDRFYKILISDSEKFGLKNWFYLYRHLFPDHPNTSLGNKLIPTFKEEGIHTNNMGFIAQCLYGGNNQDVYAKNKSEGSLKVINNLISQKVGYQRTRESLTKRFDCLLIQVQKSGLKNLLPQKEVSLIINGLIGNKYHRNKRHLTKLGVSDETIQHNKKLLLHLVNYEWGFEKYCENINETVSRLK